MLGTPTPDTSKMCICSGVNIYIQKLFKMLLERFFYVPNNVVETFWRRFLVVLNHVLYNVFETFWQRSLQYRMKRFGNVSEECSKWRCKNVFVSLQNYVIAMFSDNAFETFVQRCQRLQNVNC